MFTGLLDFVENDDELSIIMAHEMSHVRKFYNQKILNAFYLIFSLFTYSFLNKANMENILSQKNLLKELSKTQSPYKKLILEKADSKLIQAICESAYNILEGNIQLDAKSKQALLKYKNLLRKLVQKSSLKQKKKLLVQSGGALPAILPLVLSSLASAVGSYLASKQ